MSGFTVILHQMEERMIELADSIEEAGGLTLRALNQAARELMLAQSSDWAFIMDTQTMVDYAIKRTNNHIGRFQRIYDDLQRGTMDEQWLNEVEERDSIFPHVDYQVLSFQAADVAGQ